MRDCVLLVDLFNDFQHENGEQLLSCFRERLPDIEALLARARPGTPVIYANDSYGIFDGDASRIVERATRGPARSLLNKIVPTREDRFVVKPRYSAFDHTPLVLILDDLEIERVIVAGMSTEGCVTQTAIDAREAGLKVTVVSSACCTADQSLEKMALAHLERVVGAQVVHTI